MDKKIVIISAVSFNSGGPLAILHGCLSYLDESDLHNKYRIIAIVSDKELFSYKNIEYIEIPKVQGRWLYRLYLENVYFYFLSKKMRPYLWFSLQITPNVCAERRVVYMHNPTPFYKWKIIDLFRGYKYVMYALFYKYIYRLNIRRNNIIVVQQEWLRQAFSRMFNIPYERFVVAYPLKNQNISFNTNGSSSSNKICQFFFPAVPRPFKNFEVICAAVDVLKKRGVDNYRVVLTIDGTENSYSKYVYRKYRHLKNIIWTGLLPQEKVFSYYRESTCLIFPSKLETWGLPISEFSAYNKPMLVADLPYAHETASGASLVYFFSPDNALELASQMENIVNDDLSILKAVPLVEKKEPFTCSWNELFDYLLNDKML